MIKHSPFIIAFATVVTAAFPSTAEAVASLTGVPAWVASWTTAPQLVEAKDLPAKPGFSGRTLRQDVRVSVGGSRIRLRFSNEFGRTPLILSACHVALPAPGGAIVPQTDRPLSFSGHDRISIPAGAYVLSDTLSFDLPALSDLAITLCVEKEPAEVTGHPGSRTTSYLSPGLSPEMVEMQSGVSLDHWYIIKGIDVENTVNRGAVAILGDSLADGRGSTTNGNDRWPVSSAGIYFALDGAPHLLDGDKDHSSI